jgi:molecular chaperone GrpE
MCARHSRKEAEASVEIPIQRGKAPDDSAAPADSTAADAGADDVLRALEEEKKRFEDLWLRARAEFDNYRRRVAREEEERERRAAERILLSLLEIQDSLDKALASGLEAPAGGADAALVSFRRGIELIRQQVSGLLAREGVSPIEAAGAPFDPRLHEATLRVDAKGLESDTVVDVIQKGYLLGDRLLRPARVSVAR